MSIPSHFGRYRTVAHLATGGMAQVFIARLEGPGQFQRTVAVKRVLPHLVEDERFREMFLDEARVSAAIHHPAVAEVYDLVSDGEVYLVMEYVAGETVLRLSRALRKRGQTLDWPLAVYIVAQAAAGLHAAHTLRLGSVPQPIIHRDVSPQNILVSYEGDVKLIDFGIAKIRGQEGRTQAGEVKGKFAYMSPEQARSQELDARSDIFSLGIVLWELVTGRRLFARENEVATLQAVFHEEIVKPSELASDLPKELDEIVLTALARDRDQRHRTADELRRDLEALLAAHSITNAREELAVIMHEEFAERIATKEMLVHSDPPEGRVPSLATPTVTEISVIGPERTRRSEAPPPERAPARRAGVAPRWWIAAAASVLGVVAWIAWAPPGGREGERTAAAAAAPASGPTSVAAEPVDRAPAVDRTSVLEGSSTPSGAEVFLDGTFLGITPLRWRHEGAREGTLTLRLDGYEAETLPLELPEGGVARISRELARVQSERSAPPPRARRPVRGTAERATASEPATARTQEAAPEYFRFD